MKLDSYGRQILTEDDLCNIYLQDPDHIIQNAIVENNISFDDMLEINNIPKLQLYQVLNDTLEKFDNDCQNNWFMPIDYQTMDIAKYVLDLCVEEYELQRAGEELIKFQERGMFPLLCYCKYLVDTMRKHNIVWGVGRGSSVSSYVLYLLGIHRINSLHYGLSIDEFLK
jgi:DNA polymerase III alpha subunit